MMAHRGPQSGQPRHDSFGPSAESREKVWFDKTGDDAHIRFDQMTIDQSRSAIPRRADCTRAAGFSGS